MPKSNNHSVSRNLVVFLAIIAVVVSVGGTWLVLSQVGTLQSPPEAKFSPQPELTEQAPALGRGVSTTAKVTLDIQRPTT